MGWNAGNHGDLRVGIVIAVVGLSATVAVPCGPARAASSGDISAMQGQVKSQIAACWQPPSGAKPVMLRWKLNRSGGLVGQPSVVAGEPAGSDSAKAAIAAVRCASPFSLPANLYDSWQEIVWPFKP